MASSQKPEDRNQKPESWLTGGGHGPPARARCTISANAVPEVDALALEFDRKDPAAAPHAPLVPLLRRRVDASARRGQRATVPRAAHAPADVILVVQQTGLLMSQTTPVVEFHTPVVEFHDTPF